MLRQRVITAVIMLVLFYAATVWLPAEGFGIALAVVLLPALLEWGRLSGLKKTVWRWVQVVLFYLLIALTVWASRFSDTQLSLEIRGADWILWLNALAVLFWLTVLFAIRAYPEGTRYWDRPWLLCAAAGVTLLPAWWNLVYLKLLDPGGLLVFALIALVSVVDIGAYFTGKAWGRSRLAPALSPNKSWAGFWGGLATTVLLAALLVSAVHTMRQPLHWLTWAGLLSLAVLMGVLSVVGDLFESMLKRQRGIKDSGASLPGHGGLLDRIDSLLAAIPVYTLGIWFLASRVAWL